MYIVFTLIMCSQGHQFMQFMHYTYYAVYVSASIYIFSCLQLKVSSRETKTNPSITTMSPTLESNSLQVHLIFALPNNALIPSPVMKYTRKLTPGLYI